ncbi:ThiF family adenylyltransferase [Methyloversatilis discipulorum]|uniref:ThiF family adenylyltransferase n=1 Tax=Methyloversatilis discipulorum TaxID=1119528 RepID=UPI0009DA82AC|nr:ThiF family adenylyltransferase [Methyloversatilis discipulorum]
MADQNTPRAFSGIDRLYGNGAYAKLRKSSITIVGVGGVGSWTTEAIARHGIQNINIIDLDNVAAMQQRWMFACWCSIKRPPTGSIGLPDARLRALRAVLS